MFGYFTTVVFSLAAVIALSVLISPQTPSAQLQLRNVQVFVLIETIDSESDPLT